MVFFFLTENFFLQLTLDSPSRKLLSFPWLAWDVINIVRRSNSVSNPMSEARFSFDPLSEKVSRHINEYIKNRKKRMHNFFAFMYNPEDSIENERVAWTNIADYCRRHKGFIFIFIFCFFLKFFLGLDRLLFFCVKWAKTSNILNEQINMLHICLLLIQFGLNYLPCESVETVPYWLEPVSFL